MTDASFLISGFADEIADDFDEQLAVLEDLEIEAIDIRGVDGTNVLDLTDEEAAAAAEKVDDQGLAVTSIGSPIGKIGIEDPFEPHLERLDVAIDRAEQFGTDQIRVFSYYIPEGEEPADYREAVLDRTAEMVNLAEDRGVTLLHENEKDIYGDTPGRCRDLLTTIDSDSYRAVFDPANFLEIGVDAYPDALLDLIEFVDQLHIKDATKGERGEIKPAGEGDGHIPEVLDAFQRRGFSGAASLEPHLAIAGKKSGFSGPDAYGVATEALRDCLDQIDATYH